MKVKELIAELQKFDPELPVAVADWNEEYRSPSEGHCVPSLAEDYFYYPAGSDIRVSNRIRGTFVCLG